MTNLDSTESALKNLSVLLIDTVGQTLHFLVQNAIFAENNLRNNKHAWIKNLISGACLNVGLVILLLRLRFHASRRETRAAAEKYTLR